METCTSFSDAENLESLKTAAGALPPAPILTEKSFKFYGKPPTIVHRIHGQYAPQELGVREYGKPLVEVAGYVDKEHQLALLQSSGEALLAYQRKMFPASFYGNNDVDDSNSQVISELGPYGAKDPLAAAEYSKHVIERTEAEMSLFNQLVTEFALENNISETDVKYDSKHGRLYYEAKVDLNSTAALTPSVDGGSKGAGIQPGIN